MQLIICVGLCITIYYYLTILIHEIEAENYNFEFWLLYIKLLVILNSHPVGRILLENTIFYKIIKKEIVK